MGRAAVKNFVVHEMACGVDGMLTVNPQRIVVEAWWPFSIIS